MEGYKKIPRWLRDAYRKAVMFRCEHCGKHEDTVGKLIPHRLKRGSNGGLYIPRNVKMLCKKHHREYHEKEI